MSFHLWTATLLFLSSVSFAEEAPVLPSEKIRVQLLRNTVAEIDRLDGEGLIPRKNRPESWKATVSKLETEIRKAKTTYEVGQVFKRLDATYPNLHAHITLAPQYDLRARGGKLQLGITFRPEKIERGQTKFKYLVGRVRPEMMTDVPEKDRPVVGDEVVGINKKDMSWWSNQNFLFCKFPLREQCEDEFFDDLRRELLQWNREAPLSFEIKRGSKKWTVKIPVKEEVANSGNQNSTDKAPPCDVEPDRYPEFKLVYGGFNACIFESEKHPDVSVWRIKSFRYRQLPKDARIQSLKGEVDAISENYWKDKRTKIKKVIFDVIENGGGDTPVAWYQLFFSKPFQEQYFETKKIKELEDQAIRKEIFYDDNAHEIWFQNIKKNGIYEKTKAGNFLPTQPQFCADDTKDCTEGLFPPKLDGYSGEIRILVDQYCISSCVGFVWNFKDVMKDKVRVLGFPDSADSAYARVYLDAALDKDSPEGFKLTVLGRPGRTDQELPKGALFRQQVSVTRSTDSKGKVISGIPVHVDEWITKRFHYSDDPWETQVFKAALKN